MSVTDEHWRGQCRRLPGLAKEARPGALPLILLLAVDGSREPSTSKAALSSPLRWIAQGSPRGMVYEYPMGLNSNTLQSSEKTIPFEKSGLVEQHYSASSVGSEICGIRSGELAGCR